MPASQESPTTGNTKPVTGESASSTTTTSNAETPTVGNLNRPTVELSSSGTETLPSKGCNSFGWMTFGQSDTCFQIMFGYNNPCQTDNTNVFNPVTPSTVEETVTTGTA